jgi:predicted ATPase
MADETLPEPLSLTLRNVKQHRELTVDLSGRMIVLVGPNGVGKSTVLKAISSIGRLHHENGANWDWRSRLRLAFGAEEDAPFGDDVGRVLQTWRSAADVVPEVSLQFTNGALAVRLQEPAKVGGIAALTAPGEAANVPASVDAEELIKRRAQSACVRAAKSRYLQPEFSALTRQSPVSHSEIGPRGENLASSVAELLLRFPELHAAVQRGLQQIIPELTHIGARQLRMPDGKDGFDAFELELRYGSSRVASHGVSEGTLIALAVLVLSQRSEGVRFILLDDVDRGLHPTAQKALIDQLRGVLKARPELKIICTTHSPYIVSHFEPSEVRVLGRSKATGDTVCKRLDQHPKIDEYKRYLDAGEYWASVGEDWVGE